MSEKKVEKSGGNKLRIILIILCLIVIIGGGAFGSYLVLSKKNNNGNNQGNINVNMNNNNFNNNNNNNMYRPAVSEHTYDLGEFLLNLSDADARRFLKARIHVGFNNKKMLKELEAKKAVILDSVNTVIRSKKHTDFSPEGTEKIKVEILNKINPMFKEGLCDNVYFTEILVQ